MRNSNRPSRISATSTVRQQAKIGAATLICALSLVTEANAGIIDFTTVSDGTYSAVSLGGVTVTGSNTVTSAFYAGFRGLGITGGGSNVSLDTGETMTIDFGLLATNAKVTLVDIAPFGNVTFNFHAFNGATDLGTFSFPSAVSAPETYDLFALSGGLDMTSFQIDVTAGPPLGLQIQAISFDSVPEPGTLALLGLGLTGLAASLRRKL